MAPAAHPDRVAGNPGGEGGGEALPERGRVVHLVPPPGPVLPLTLRGVVLRLGQGHRDAQTFVPKELSESSLPPAGTACAAACNAVDIHG